MFSKPLASVLLGLGCLTAAAGGAYVATRHNMSDAGTVAARPAEPATQAATPAPAQPVAETEAAVTSPKAEAAPVEPVKAEAPAVSERRAEPTPARRDSTPARPAAKPAQTAKASEPTPAQRPVQRTVPVNAAPAAQNDPTTVPQASSPAPSAPPPFKPAEAMRPVEPPQPEPPRVPQYDELILPAASVIGLQIETSMSTERARVEDRVDARVSRDVMAGGRVAIPAGSRVIGSVTTVERGGKVKEQARLGIRFHTLVLADGSQVPLHTDPIYRNGDSPAASSSKKIGGAAIGGAILGAILGGGKGAAIGGATGAAGGTAAVMAGDRNAATLRQGEYLNVKLAAPATVTVERHE